MQNKKIQKIQMGEEKMVEGTVLSAALLWTSTSTHTNT